MVAIVQPAGTRLQLRCSGSRSRVTQRSQAGSGTRPGPRPGSPQPAPAQLQRARRAGSQRRCQRWWFGGNDAAYGTSVPRSYRIDAGRSMRNVTPAAEVERSTRANEASTRAGSRRCAVRRRDPVRASASSHVRSFGPERGTGTGRGPQGGRARQGPGRQRLSHPLGRRVRPRRPLRPRPRPRLRRLHARPSAAVRCVGVWRSTSWLSEHASTKAAGRMRPAASVCCIAIGSTGTRRRSPPPDRRCQ
jgi:hypothetical protein